LPADAVLSDERREALLSSVPRGSLRDVWWTLVLVECARVVVDLFHLILALALLCIPWRFAFAVRQLLEPGARRSARLAGQAFATLELWERACDRMEGRLELAVNEYSKAVLDVGDAMLDVGDAGAWGRRPHYGRDRSECEGCVALCCCVVCACLPNYSAYDDAGDFSRDDDYEGGAAGVNGGETRFRRQLELLGGSLAWSAGRLRAKRERWPTTPEWAPLGAAVDARLRKRAESIFWPFVLLRAQLSLRRASRGGPLDRHGADMCEQLRAHALRKADRHRNEWPVMADRLQALQSAARAAGGCACKSRDLRHAIVREELAKGLGDLLALPVLLLLLLTFYRLPKVCEGGRAVLGKQGCDAQLLKEALIVQAVELVTDLLLLAQLIVVAGLLALTVVKFPDFLAGLRPTKGLRANRNWALAMLSELAVGIGELFVLLTVFKTYRLIVSAAVFAALTPAAIMSVALPARLSAEVRFGFMSAVWLGMLVQMYGAAGVGVQMQVAGVVALASVGFCSKGVKGWLTPPGDWWSPVARCTTPNLLALGALVVDAVILAMVAAVETPLWTPFPSLADSFATWLFSFVGMPIECPFAVLLICLSLLLTTVPMVAHEKERESIVQDSSWRCCCALLHEVLFLPLVASLAQASTTSWPHCLCLAYYVLSALLAPAVWEARIDSESLLDVRQLGVFASGARLLLAASVFAATSGSPVGLQATASALTLWTLVGAFVGASSVPWAGVLHVGVGAGGLAAASGGLRGAAAAWLVAAVFAFARASAARRRLAAAALASEVPAAVARLARIQTCLSLWGDASPIVVPTVDAFSPQVVAVAVRELEARLPFERLDPDFLAHRGSWLRRLSAASTFSQLSAKLEALEKAVRVPPQRAMLVQLLGKVRPQSAGRCRGLPRPVASLVVSYVAEAAAPMELGDEVVPAEWWTAAGQFDLIRISQAARARADMAVTGMNAPQTTSMPTGRFA